MTPNGPVLVEIGARVMGSDPMHPATQHALGYSPLDVILDSYLDEKSFNSFAQKPYVPKSHLLFKDIVSRQSGDIESITAYETLKLLPTLYDCDFSDLEYSEHLEVSKDLLTSSGRCTLLSEDEEALLEDYRRIRFIEEYTPSLLWRLSDNSESSPDETASQGDCHFASEKLSSEVINTINNNHQISALEDCLQATSGECPFENIDFLAAVIKNAKEHPDQPIIKQYSDFSSQETSYEEMAKKSISAVDHLRACDINKGDVVAALSSDFASLYAIFLATLEIGAIFFAIDHEYPNQLIRQLLDQTKARLFVTENALELAKNDPSTEKDQSQEGVVDSFESTTFEETFRDWKNIQINDSIVNADRTGFSDASEPRVPLSVAELENDDVVAYVATSGTTGEPKIARITNGNLQNIHISYKAFIPVFPHEVQLVMIRESFIGFIVLLTRFSYASTIVFCDAMAINTMDKFRELLIETKTDSGFVPLPYYDQYLAEGLDKKMKAIGMGGAKIEISRMPSCLLYENYGCTELTGAIGFNNIENLSCTGRIEHPAYNTRLYLVNKDHRLCLPGESGELWVASKQVSKGYLNNSEVTGDSYIANPFFSNVIHADWMRHVYKTGDYMSLGSDGYYHFENRRDKQVQIGGKRIELGEIEAIAREVDGVQEAQAIVRTDGDAPIIALFVVFNKDPQHSEQGKPQTTTDEVRQYLVEHLAPFKVPSYIMELSEMPRNKNHKISLSALQEMPLVLDEGQALLTLESHQKKIAEILSETTGIQIELIDVDKAFTELGLSSLNIVAFVERIAQEFEREILLNDLVAHTTVRSLAEHLEGKHG